MDKHDLTQQFAGRLRDALIRAGYQSERSTSGVSIHKLAQITGYSVQICRKYLRGEAIPEFGKIIDIAEALSVSPGWLLFGEEPCQPNEEKKTITLNKELLYYAFSNTVTLFRQNQSDVDVPTFLMDLLNDLSQIDANEEQSKKIIDLTLTSIKHFSAKP